MNCSKKSGTSNQRGIYKDIGAGHKTVPRLELAKPKIDALEIMRSDKVTGLKAIQ